MKVQVSQVGAAGAAPKTAKDLGFTVETDGGFMYRDAAASVPGKGEIVGGADDALVNTLMKLARKRGGADEVKHAVMSALATARYEGQAERDKLSTKNQVEIARRMDEKIVCGFIAEVNHAERLYAGLPPSLTWTINALTTIKIVDALNRAGYSASGKE